MRGLLALLYCWLALGCSGGEPPGASGGPRLLGEHCEKTEECASRLCVRLDDSGGICSKACDSAQTCPASDNWDCLAAPSQSFSVCACLPLADHEVCGDGLDNDCNGRVDDCQVCGGEPVPTDDHENCGACGNACRADQACDGKGCSCPETAPEECGGKCTSLETDALNCGECGSTCSLGQVCLKGKCSCDDFVKSDFCPGSGCLDLDSDPAHCGSCGNACTLGQSCLSGRCSCPAGGPKDFCADVGCVDVSTDLKNCGTCGNSCETGQSCAAGKCACPTGQTTCDGSCVDLATDEQNCGECGAICPLGQACIGGACGCNGATITACGEDCADLLNDVDNCGTCGNVCADGEQCKGQCQCPSGVFCGTSCMPEGDSQNCGACGNACSASQYCNGGRCECQGFGLTKCGEGCYSLSTDSQHCGSCSRACRTGEECVSGDCQCPYGQTYCEAAGKCVTLTADAANCGSCGHACNPSETCSSGVCACPQSGQKYCAAEGKCVDTQSNTAHCGSCETKCKATEVCSFGSCDCSGSTQEYCTSASACVDVWTNNQHCGACDKACPAGTQCSFGACACPTSGQTLCGSTCTDLQTNSASCGACGNACTGGKVCSGGQCRCENPSVGVAVRLTDNTVTDAAPVAAWDGAHVGVAYFQKIGVASGNTGATDYYNLRFALLNPDGSPFKDVALTQYLDGQLHGAATGTDSGKVVFGRPGITWNGSEYAVVWADYDFNAVNRATLRLARVSSAGAVIDSAVVATDADMLLINGPAIAWSAAYGGYLVSVSDGYSLNQKVFYRRVGPQGKTLDPLNSFTGTSCDTSIAVAPNGLTAVSCGNASTVAFFNLDGSRTRTPVNFNYTTVGNADTVWDGATFDTAVVAGYGGIVLYRDGRKANSSVLELLPSVSGLSRTALNALWLGNSLALGAVQAKTYVLWRFALSTNLEVGATRLTDPLTVVPSANVLRIPALAPAGEGKLLAIWADDRWSAVGELYAAPIDLKGCK